MRILAVIRRVPDSMATIKVKGDNSGIEEGGLKFVMNPFDEFAVEQALRIKEGGASVEEIVVAMPAPAAGTDVMRTALAMGADRGIHIETDAVLADEAQAAKLVAAAVEAKGGGAFDLVLTGKRAIDLDSDGFGPALAECLNLPHVGAIQGFELNGDAATVRRRIEGAEEVIDVSFPALLTIEKGLCEPRYPTLPNMMKAKKKPVETVSAAELGVAAPQVECISVNPPPERAACKFIEGDPAAMAQGLVKALREEAGAI